MKPRRKKPAKAVTLLTKIEALLADTLTEFSVIEKSVEKNVRALLLSAEESIAKAKDFIAATPAVARHLVTPAKRRTRAKAKPVRTARARKLAAVHG